MEHPQPSSPDGIAVGGVRLQNRWVVVAFAVVVAALGLAFSQLLPLAVFTGFEVLGISLPVLPAVTLQLVLVELVGFGVATVAYLRLRHLSSDYIEVRRPTVRDLGWMVGGSAAVVVFYFGYVSVAVALGAPIARSGISIAGQSNPDILLLLAGLSFVLIGPMEELFFRGVVQETMREVLSPVAAVSVASLTFASIHYLTLVGPFLGKLVLLGSLFITSLLFGAAYERTRNLVVNAVMHGTYNAVLLVLAYVVFSMGLA